MASNAKAPTMAAADVTLVEALAANRAVVVAFDPLSGAIVSSEDCSSG